MDGINILRELKPSLPYEERERKFKQVLETLLPLTPELRQELICQGQRLDINLTNYNF